MNFKEFTRAALAMLQVQNLIPGWWYEGSWLRDPADPERYWLCVEGGTPGKWEERRRRRRPYAYPA